MGVRSSDGGSGGIFEGYSLVYLLVLESGAEGGSPVKLAGGRGGILVLKMKLR